MSELDEKLNILANSQLTLTNTVNRFVESHIPEKQSRETTSSSSA
jgi:hypothetical protein